MIRARLLSRILAVAATLCLLPATGPRLSGQTNRTGGIIALKGATVVTVTKGTIPNGTVLIRDGKIAAVAATVDVPSGAEVIDVTGRFISPGIIDAHSHIASDSINEGGTTVSSMTGIQDVLDPTDINIYRDLAGGLTVANVLHGSANPIGGKNAVIKLRWGKTRAEELLVEGALPGIKFALGENPKDMRQFGQTGPRRYPVTRAGTEFVIRDAFTRAKAYQKAWKEFEKRKAAGEDLLQPRRDLQLEPLVEILEGKRLVHAHSYRADEILMMIRVAEEMGFKITTFQHVLEGYKVAKEIAAHGAGASTFSDWWGYKIEAVDAIPHNAAIMTRKGVLVSINSDSAEHARRLNTEAAKSIKWGGLTDDEALALVTINPAKQLRIDNRVGSLEAGKDADLVVWTHHPLSTYAIVDRTYIDGTVYYDRKAEERRLTELRKEKTDLAAADRSERKSPTAEQQPRTESSRGSDSPPRENEVNGAAGPVDRPTGTTATRGATVSQTRTAGPVAVWAITNATIHPVTAPAIERGTIIIRGSKIEAVGSGIPVPTGTKVVDAGGGHVYPGFINGRTTIGLSEPGPRGFDDVSEILDLNPQLRTRVAYHSESDAIPVARTNGVTTVAVVPSGGTFGGEVPVMNLDGWTWEEATLKPNAGIAFNFPSLSTAGGRGGGGGGRGAQPPDRTFEDVKKDRDRRLDDLMRLFDQARAYSKAADGKTVDWVLEALVPVVERRLPLIVSVSREQDIKDAVAFAGRAKVNIVISGGAEAVFAAQLLKEKNIPVILGNTLTMPAREDMFHADSYQLAGQLAQAGIKFAFSTGDNTNVRLLPYNAAMAVAWGLSKEAALKALTIDAADILGISDRVGSIEPGKDANLFIAKGDPLEIRTAITHVIIGGRDVGLADKHQALYEKYLARQ
ncbi:MAG: amidohydrolase family protein [Acidobacteria bacterium]|nr:amidohydrolase family protein [Acidobacteriota bacterium]